MAGYREFQTGEVLTAANVNSFLMEQTTMTFADAAARDVALAGVLREGLLTYNLDTNRLEVYDGTDWVEPAPEPPAGIGSNVVQAVKTDTFSWNVNGLQDVPDLSASITPSSNTSKIFCLVHLNFGVDQTTGNWTAGATLFRGATALYVGSTTPNPVTIGWSPEASGQFANPTGVAMFLDSPNTDAATTYKISVERFQPATFYINRRGADTTVSFRVPSSLTLIEVAA